jgi:hypothetical protein
MKKIKAFIPFLLFCLSVVAQDSLKQSTQLKFSVNYNTHLNYYGRTDSLKSSGFFPLAELWFNESFYINAAPVFVNNSAVSMDYAGTVASAGFLLKSGNKWLANLYVVKPFYEESSKLVQSALKAQTGFTVTRLNKAINVTIGADAKFSDKTDFGAQAGLDHIVRINLADNSIIVIDPSVYVHAGTQQFSKSYYEKTGFLIFPGFELVSEDVKKFSVLSYELSLPVIWAKGKCQLLFTPAYVMPQNLIGIERGSNMFYATLGAKVIL